MENFMFKKMLPVLLLGAVSQLSGCNEDALAKAAGFDLTETETETTVCYSYPFGSNQDPLNVDSKYQVPCPAGS